MEWPLTVRRTCLFSVLMIMTFRSLQRLLTTITFLSSSSLNKSSTVAAFSTINKTSSRPTLTTTRTQSRLMSSNNDEVEKAKAAAAAAEAGEPTAFDKILSGEWSSDKVYDDEQCYAFRDINPQSPVHVVLIPKKRDGLTQIRKARTDQKELLGHLMYVAGQIGQQECPDGFRIVVNDGKEGAQSVYHLHLHILGGRQLSWPPG